MMNIDMGRSKAASFIFETPYKLKGRYRSVLLLIGLPFGIYSAFSIIFLNSAKFISAVTFCRGILYGEQRCVA